MLSKLIKAGYDIRATTVWSLYNVFEWNYGYVRGHYGLYEVDPETLKRMPRLSAAYFKQLMTLFKKYRDEKACTNK
jgi:beta-glucosidase/6-phospho-beta-glucosidase/beta-galactosidase